MDRADAIGASGNVRLELTNDEALVLFELLSRWGDSDKLEISGEVEQRALLRLLGSLEKQLVEPFEPNYLQLVRQAREKLRHPRD